MINFLEELKNYFENTPRKKILEDWAKSAEFDNVGPTVEEFLHNTNQYYHIISQGPNPWIPIQINKFDPKFTSGFLITNQNISVCKKQHFQ